MSDTTSKIRLTISYGYDIHKIDLSKSTYEKVMNGDSIEISGQGFVVEGRLLQDFWKFDQDSLEVYCDDGFEVYAGPIKNAIVGAETINL